jgi:hypothetical protein
MIEARPINLADVYTVVCNMRMTDWQEVINLVPKALATPDGITMLTMQHTRLGTVYAYDDLPVVVLQANEIRDGVWSIGMFATDLFPLVWRAMVKDMKRAFLPVLLDSGARYCEAHVAAGNVDAQRLLKFLGFRQRSDVLEGFGSFGDPFLLYVATIGDLPHVFHARPPGTGSPRASRSGE